MHKNSHTFFIQYDPLPNINIAGSLKISSGTGAKNLPPPCFFLSRFYHFYTCCVNKTAFHKQACSRLFLLTSYTLNCYRIYFRNALRNSPILCSASSFSVMFFMLSIYPLLLTIEPFGVGRADLLVVVVSQPFFVADRCPDSQVSHPEAP